MISRAAQRFGAAVSAGRFELQQCRRCAALQYPPREACHRCLSVEFEWVLQPGTGRLISQTTLFHSHDPYFRSRLPWRIGLVQLDTARPPGPVAVAHVHESVGTAPCAVGVRTRLDRNGRPVMIALSGAEGVALNDDPRIREMSSDPRGCGVLVTDGSSDVGSALVRELAGAGAKQVWVGELSRQSDAAAGLPGAGPEILINTAGCGAPGNDAREQMERHYFSLLRLWDVFGPVMQHPGRTWVNILSLDALCNLPSRSTFSASMAAALSLSEGIRARTRASGLRVVNVFAGPVPAETLARETIAALIDGTEDVYPGEVAQQWLARWLESPKVLEREVAAHA